MIIAIFHAFNYWDPNFWSDLFVDLIALVDIVLVPVLFWCAYSIAKEQYELEMLAQKDREREKRDGQETP